MKNTELDFDWSALPKWANWIAMDKGGMWCWYIDEPLVDETHGCYLVDELDRIWHLIPESYTPKNFTGNWKKSLFEVPKNKAE